MAGRDVEAVFSVGIAALNEGGGAVKVLAVPPATRRGASASVKDFSVASMDSSRAAKELVLGPLSAQGSSGVSQPETVMEGGITFTVAYLSFFAVSLPCTRAFLLFSMLRVCGIWGGQYFGK